jgi:predicted transcriptional regulator
LREKHRNPLIIDLIDNHDVFLNQFTKRRAFYNEKNYKIIRTNQEKYNDYVKYLKSLKLIEEKSILACEEEIILNITNQENNIDLSTMSTSSVSPSPTSSVNPSINHNVNFWNYLLFKPRRNNKNNTTQPTNLSESKCLIQL